MENKIQIYPLLKKSAKKQQASIWQIIIIPLVVAEIGGLSHILVSVLKPVTPLPAEGIVWRTDLNDADCGDAPTSLGI